MSPTVSTRRRSEPASLARTQASCARTPSRIVSARPQRAIEQDLGLARPGAGLDRLEDLLLLALGDARVPAERAGARGGLELGERRDPELVVDAAGGLRRRRPAAA